MEKVTLTAVYHQSANKEGVPYVSKAGKPYERCSIKTAQHGEKYLSGFGSKTTRVWQVGDEVEIEIEQKGEYLNFSVPKVEQGGFTDQDRERMRRIEGLLANINDHVMRLYKHAGIDKTPDYPEYDKAPDFGEDTNDEPN